MPSAVVVSSPEQDRHPKSSESFWRSLAELEKTFHRVRQETPELPVLAVFWLHIKHPLLPIHERFMALASKPTHPQPFYRDLKFWARLFLHLLLWPAYVLYSLGHTVRMSVKIGILRLLYRLEIQVLEHEQFGIVAKTWCFQADQIKSHFDFYYGDLSQALEREGIRLLLLCGNQGNLGFLSFARALFWPHDARRIPEWCVLRPLDPWHYLMEQYRASLKLVARVVKVRSSLERWVALRASRDCLGRQNLLDGLNFAMARRAVFLWHPKAFLTLYEGHAWEKCAWWGAREADPACRIAGYQHTVIFRESRALVNPCIDLPARSLPDVVLSLGPTTADMLRPSHESYGTHFQPFGSYRHPGARASEPASLQKRTILVTPEGLLDEVRALFSLAYDCAKHLPQHTFILRTHPSLSIRQAQHVLPA